MSPAAPTFYRLQACSLAWCGAMVFATAMAAAADRAIEIARIHVEAVGGEERVHALSAMRMTGQAIVREQRVPFVLWAARPNRLRMETQFPGRTVVQACDGIQPPWEYDPEKSPARPASMSPTAAERFMADADFDDPLVQGHAGRLHLEFAGETEVRGRKLLRVLVARKPTENIFVLLDPSTYLIVFRVQELTKNGRRVEAMTRYDAYRPVAGVLVPHEIALFVEGELAQQIKIEAIEANPALSPESFIKP